jgi:predicted RNA methylase
MTTPASNWRARVAAPSFPPVAGVHRMTPFATTLAAVIDAGQDFEWYPTTSRMIGEVARRLSRRVRSVMDIGAGDGRVLLALAKVAEDPPELFAIEKSLILLQSHPQEIAPVGVDFHEQNLSALPVDVIFSNPPYSEFEVWATRIVETAFAERAYLVLPRRWKESQPIAAALETRQATARVIYSDTFEHDADRRARAVVDIVEVTFPMANDYRRQPVDPFDQWFDQHISTFDTAPTLDEDHAGVDMARVRGLTTIGELVDAYNEDYARMEENYRAIFKLDYAILKELGVAKEAVRDGLKKRMAGLKTEYWQLLFEKLDAITSRLSTKTKKLFLDRLTGQQSVAFTYNNAFAVVMWAIRHANRYYDQQVVDLFRQLATFDGVANYKSNVKTWEQRDWRYNSEDHSHFALDYRIVIRRHAAIFKGGFGGYDYPGGLSTCCHELIDDMIAVFGNLGFPIDAALPPSRRRSWTSGAWQDFEAADGRVVFQVKAYLNGNVHVRMLPDAIKALNVEAGRLLGWLHGPDDVERELGYSADEARAFFGSNRQLTAGSVKMLAAGGAAC